MICIAGCTIKSLGETECNDYLAWVLSSGNMPHKEATGLQWLLALCDDGVVWGYWDDVLAQWKLSSRAFPDASPVITTANLQEMRVFGEVGEILMWKENGVFAGRALTDNGSALDKESPLRPSTEERLLLGDRILEDAADGFTKVGDSTGSQQAVPLVCTSEDFRGGIWPLRLQLRHYFEADVCSGAVRAAACRLVKVYKETR